MNAKLEQTTSVWMQSGEIPVHAALTADVKADVCPHLGCIVDWNHNESTWDCPCHGSRFDKQGHPICGPANSDLPAIHKE